MAIKGKKTILGKKSLILIAQGEKEIAAQIFLFEKIREVRVNVETLEVKLLMTFDEAYFRVFSISTPEDATPKLKEKAKANVLKFYNDLLNAASQFTPEDLKSFVEQDKKRIEEFKKNQVTKEDQKEKDNDSSLIEVNK